MKTNYISTISKAFFLLSLLAVLVSPASSVRALPIPTMTGSAVLAIAGNDDFSAALRITTLPFRRTVTSFEATEAVDDPTSNKCNLSPGLATVWYKYRPTVDTMVHMDTIGSSYDTYMAIWRGTRGSLTEVACNDDATTTTFASAINITLKANTLYYIEVAQFNGTLADVGLGAAKPVTEVGAAVGATHVFRLVKIVRKVFRSAGTYDGYVVESKENSNKGLFKNSTLPYVQIGDDSNRRQARAILSFDTATMPNNAVITQAFLKAKRSDITSATIFTVFGGLMVDIRTPYFGAGLSLAAADFEAAASKALAGRFNPTAVSGWHTAGLKSTSFPYFNLRGSTQFRLRFSKDDDNDIFADYIRLYSGNSTDANRPILIVRYYIP